jgi:hypothetical protein
MDNDHEKLLAVVKEETEEEKIDIENHSLHLPATYSSGEYQFSRQTVLIKFLLEFTLLL